MTSGMAARCAVAHVHATPPIVCRCWLAGLHEFNYIPFTGSVPRRTQLLALLSAVLERLPAVRTLPALPCAFGLQAALDTLVLPAMQETVAPSVRCLCVASAPRLVFMRMPSTGALRWFHTLNLTVRRMQCYMLSHAMSHVHLGRRFICWTRPRGKHASMLAHLATSV